jgi:photosystem II stability/assembly factor-like uncharacterized protein
MRRVLALTVVLALLVLLPIPASPAEEKDVPRHPEKETPRGKQGSAEQAEAARQESDRKEKKERKERKDRKDEKPATKWSSKTFSGLALREIGPALTSGRIVDVVVDPTHRATWYVAAASGGVWKTVNAGTTWTPLFDKEGSFAIGCLALDPKDPRVVWVGTGENNSQRSVSYGDGIYKSVDGGTSWKKMGLEESMHIGRIAIDPRDSDVVYVAAFGPLWSSGGDRGLFKTTDGGQTWEAILTISPDTGVSEVLIDPFDPDTLWATAYQRRRHVWTLINGGPEAGIHKSTDAGKTWHEVSAGLPTVDMGRIGLAASPSQRGLLYAVVEAATNAGGFFRSTDGGENWEKRGDYVSGSGQYYQEIFVDPGDPDRVFSMDTYLQVSENGGKTFGKLGEKNKHVDNHALWIDPDDHKHLLVGSDGGLYESWDRGGTWGYVANLPITQFYKVAVDKAEPFYHVYGGTQDNFTLGGPVRTANAHGIRNSDWFVTVGGDGFQSQVDPEDPNIVYSQAQYGVLVRFDRASGEILDIQPQPGPGEEPLRWNWDSPLLLSPHQHTRLYFGANRIFRSDDRGASWRAVSPDLTRKIDRNRLPVMGRVWSVDAVARNTSTSFYGNIVALAESPLREGLLLAGTDDGLVQITEDGGTTWRKVERFPGVPDKTYVSRVTPSRHHASRVYAAFDAHKTGDLKPYVLTSDDLGRTWRSVAGDLPERGSVYAILEDAKKPDLLYCGTEFGVFFSPDRGKRWIRLEGNIPTIEVRDLAIQDREDDLVVATFGRGFFVLDDLAPLRLTDDAVLNGEATLFPVRRTWMYVPAAPLGLKGKSFQGDDYYSADNPPFGAVFTYYLAEEVKTKQASRRELEKEAAEDESDASQPSWDALRAEDREEAPAGVLTVLDADGRVVRRLTGPVTAGFHRVAWDLRYPPANPTSLDPPEEDPFSEPAQGPLVAPGRYRVVLARRQDGKLVPLGKEQTFETAPLYAASIPAASRAEVLAFQERTARLQRAALGASSAADEALRRLEFLQRALQDTPGATDRLGADLRTLRSRLQDVKVALNGDTVVRKYQEPDAPSIVEQVQGVVAGHWSTTGGPTQTHRDAYAAASAAFGPVLQRLRTATEDLERLEAEADAAGAPWTPGRLPSWSPE